MAPCSSRAASNPLPFFRTARAERYYPATDSWVTVQDMGTQRYGHTASLLSSGKVLVVGGLGAKPNMGGEASLASAEVFDPATNAWTDASPMANARNFHTATRLQDGRVVI